MEPAPEAPKTKPREAVLRRYDRYTDLAVLLVIAAVVLLIWFYGDGG